MAWDRELKRWWSIGSLKGTPLDCWDTQEHTNQNIRMISEGSCDTDEWSNGCRKFSYASQGIHFKIHLKLFQILILFYNITVFTVFWLNKQLWWAQETFRGSKSNPKPLIGCIYISVNTHPHMVCYVSDGDECIPSQQVIFCNLLSQSDRAECVQIAENHLPLSTKHTHTKWSNRLK